MNKGNLSSHLARLEEAGYVEIEKTYRGNEPMTVLRLTPAGLRRWRRIGRGCGRWGREKTSNFKIQNSGNSQYSIIKPWWE